MENLAPSTAVVIFTQNINHEDFRNNLKTYTAQNMEEVRARAQTFVIASDIWKPKNPQTLTVTKSENSKQRKVWAETHSQYQPQYSSQSQRQPLQTVKPSRYEPQHQFTAPRAHILMCIREKIELKYPGKMLGDASKRDQNRYCDFHKDVGHTTEQCAQLNRELDWQASRGRLNDFLPRQGGGGSRKELPPPPDRKGQGGKKKSNYNPGYNPNVN